MRELVESKRFEIDLERALRGGLSLDDWQHLAYLLAKYDVLPEEYDEHPLTDNWEGHLDCHLSGDLVVIYKRMPKRVILSRIGTHAELFQNRKRQRRKSGFWGWLFEE
jgi:mRNA interferase YafQ